MGGPLIFLLLKILNIAYGSAILGGSLQFLILKTPNIAYESTILGGPLIFLIFVSKTNRTTKLNLREYYTFLLSSFLKIVILDHFIFYLYYEF